jgi:hypothetical protein
MSEPPIPPGATPPQPDARADRSVPPPAVDLVIGPEVPTAVLGVFRNSTEAELVRNSLRAAGVGSAIVGALPADIIPMFTGGAGVKLLVHADDLERARKHLPDSAFGSDVEVERLDAEFKRGLARLVGLLAVLAGATTAAALAFGAGGLYVGLGVSTAVVLVWILSNVRPDDDEDEPARK